MLEKFYFLVNSIIKQFKKQAENKLKMKIMTQFQTPSTHILNDFQLTLNTIGLASSTASFLSESCCFYFMFTY